MNEFQSWLWPDKTIGKRESRELREEHNRLLNAYYELQGKYELLNRKASHGCTDAFCGECD